MNSAADLVTVYITNHNYCDYLDEAIRSVLNQSYPNIEIFIIDDGSTDSSHEILEKYVSTNGIRIIRQNNLGLTKTNNVALKVANGKFIVRLDADDRFKENAIEFLVEAFESSDDIAMVFGGWDVMDEVGNLIFQYKRHNFDEEVTLLDCPAHGACTMFRVDYLQAVGGYDEELNCQDGYELWFRIIDRFRVKSIDNTIFEYRRHSNNLTNNEERILETRSKILNKVSKSKGLDAKSFAIIPIRGNALDARSAPLQRINGGYIIDHLINELISFDLFEFIVISTPDVELASYLESKHGDRILIDVREVNISNINSRLDGVLIDYVNRNKLDKKITHGVVLGVERPFNKKYLIQSALDISSIFDLDNVIGVRLNDNFLFNHTGKTLKGINFDKTGLRLERNDIYQMVRGFLVFKISNLNRDESIWGDIIGHVVFDQKSSHCIDSSLDLKISEVYLHS